MVLLLDTRGAGNTKYLNRLIGKENKNSNQYSYFMVAPPFPMIPPQALLGTTSLTFDLGSSSTSSP